MRDGDGHARATRAWRSVTCERVERNQCACARVTAGSQWTWWGGGRPWGSRAGLGAGPVEFRGRRQVRGVCVVSYRGGRERRSWALAPGALHSRPGLRLRDGPRREDSRERGGGTRRRGTRLHDARLRPARRGASERLSDSVCRSIPPPRCPGPRSVVPWRARQSDNADPPRHHDQPRRLQTALGGGARGGFYLARGWMRPRAEGRMADG